MLTLYSVGTAYSLNSLINTNKINRKIENYIINNLKQLLVLYFNTY